MKTLHIITGLSQGGAERQLANLVSVLPEESAVFSLKEPGVMAEEVRKAGLPIYTGGVGRNVSPVWIPKLRWAIRELRPDVVMGWMYHGNLAASLTRRLGHRGPVVWNVRHSVHDLGREKLSTRWVIRAGAWCAGSPARIICGCKWPLLAKVSGRVTDHLKALNGGVVYGGALRQFLYSMPYIRKCLWVKDSLEHVTLRAVFDVDAPQAESEWQRDVAWLETQVQATLGDQVRLSVDMMDEIPPSGSGKHLCVVSHV